jgi:hypothetical protein
MKNEISVKEKTNSSVFSLEEFKNTQQVCSFLLKEPHYAKMGQAGIFAIVETAKSLGIDPRMALGGGLYYVKGKVEISARLMNALIRSKKHSITKDRKSNDEICILHGKRADNGDTWTESFSIQEANQAGLASNAVWKNFTRDMLFARALSRLARQLFPDIIGNCYVEGEISLDPNIKTSPINIEELEETKESSLSSDQFKQIEALVNEQPQRKNNLLSFIESKWKCESFDELTGEQAAWVIDRLSLSDVEEKEENLEEVS